MTELVKCPPHVTHSLLNTQEGSTSVNFTAVIDPKKYSSLTRLLRISACLAVYQPVEVTSFRQYQQTCKRVKRLRD